VIPPAREPSKLDAACVTGLGWEISPSDPSPASSGEPLSSLRSNQTLLSSCTISRIPIFLTSALVTPNKRHAKSLAARIVQGGFASVVKMACAAGTHLVA